MTETRNLLLKMDFHPSRKGDSRRHPERPEAGRRGAEPGERPEELPKFSADELNKRRLERTLQALQNCRKNAMETADVAAAIEEIRLQLDNNQANNAAARHASKPRSCNRCTLIVDKMFPVLDADLEPCKGKVDDLSAGPELRDVAQKQADQILAEMRRVLDHMMKTEDFKINVVQRLKKIIEKQRELTQRTEKTEQDSLAIRSECRGRSKQEPSACAKRLAKRSAFMVKRYRWLWAAWVALAAGAVLVSAAQAAETKAEAGKVVPPAAAASPPAEGLSATQQQLAGRIQGSPGHPDEDAGPGPPDRS